MAACPCVSGGVIPSRQARNLCVSQPICWQRFRFLVLRTWNDTPLLSFSSVFTLAFLQRSAQHTDAVIDGVLVVEHSRTNDDN